MKYFIPCRICGDPVEVDQPDTSKIKITIAYCLPCFDFTKNKNLKMRDIRNLQWIQVGVSWFDVKMKEYANLQAKDLNSLKAKL
jgi:hypothetical protein